MHDVWFAGAVATTALGALGAVFLRRVHRNLKTVRSVEAATAAYYDNPVLHRRFDHPVPVAYATPKVKWVFESLQQLGIEVGRVSLLDVGGGNGYFTHVLRAGCPDTHVLDVSAEQLAMNPLPSERKHLGSAYALPFPDGAFDVVFSSNLLHHLDRPEAAVRELVRVARRAVVVMEPSVHNLLLWLGAHWVPHEFGARHFTTPFVEKLLRGAGLDIRRHTYAGGMVLPNRTREAALPFVFAGSTRRALCMSQIFVCLKPGPASGFTPARP